MPKSMNERYKPSDTDEEILSILKEESRVTPKLVTDKTDLSRQLVNQRLNSLQSAGWVIKVSRGLYEYNGDPREQE